jgi:hypothetical protein
MVLHSNQSNNLKINVFCDVKPCSLVDIHQRFTWCYVMFHDVK